MDFDWLKDHKSGLGTAAVTVMDQSTDVIKAIWRISAFFKHESCGQCTPCREGTFWLKNMVRDFLDDFGREDIIARMDRAAGQIIGTTICAFGDAVGGPMQSFVRKFPEDFRNHLARG